jgi:hypothetical protein
MDPKATLIALERAIQEREFVEALMFLNAYYQWRLKDGFAPPNGDKRADALANQLADRMDDNEAYLRAVADTLTEQVKALREQNRAMLDAVNLLVTNARTALEYADKERNDSKAAARLANIMRWPGMVAVLAILNGGAQS